MARRRPESRIDGPSKEARRAGELRSAGRYGEALDLALRRLARTPDDVAAAAVAGTALVDLGRGPEAIPYLERVEAARPDWPQIPHNLSIALMQAGRLAEAEGAVDRAMAATPDNAGVHVMRATLAKLAGRFDEAVASYRRALVLGPDNARHHLNFATTLLQSGRMTEGWEEYEWRWQTPEVAPTKRNHPFPRWQGEPLAGRKILVSGEQGIGDEVMFAGLVPELVARGAAVVLEATPRLVPLFRRSLPEIQVVATASPPLPGLSNPEIDFWTPMGDLPRLLGVDPDETLPPAPWLRADPQVTNTLRRRYLDGAPDGTRLIGISWRSGNRSTGHARTLAPEHWGPILAVPGVRFVSLQYGDVTADVERAHAAIGAEIRIDPEFDPLADMDGFAAQVAAMDMVISTDNSTVHVAGALGRPTWLLTQPVGDWRWFLDREDNIWYRSVRIMRQRTPYGWDELIERCGRELATAGRTAAPPPPRLSAWPAADRPRCLVVNDTLNWYHWGCTATSSAIRETVEALGYEVESLPIARTYALAAVPRTIDEFDEDTRFEAFSRANPLAMEAVARADVVVVNGEGTIHGLAPHVVGLLYLAWVARTRLGKPVHLINHSAYPLDRAEIDDSAACRLYHKVFGALDHVAVREHLSHGVLTRLGLAPTLAFDCLPLHVGRHPPNVEQPSNTVVLAGSVAMTRMDVDALGSFLREVADTGFEIRLLTGARAFPAADDRAFAERLAEARGLPPIRRVDAHSLDGWLGEIARARMLISGRFHHSIAAAALGTPFVAMTSNTPKVDAVLEMLDHAPPIPISCPDLTDRLIAAAETELSNPPTDELVHQRLDAMRTLALENFGGLVPRSEAAAA